MLAPCSGEPFPVSVAQPTVVKPSANRLNCVPPITGNLFWGPCCRRDYYNAPFKSESYCFKRRVFKLPTKQWYLGASSGQTCLPGSEQTNAPFVLPRRVDFDLKRNPPKRQAQLPFFLQPSRKGDTRRCDLMDKIIRCAFVVWERASTKGLDAWRWRQFLEVDMYGWMGPIRILRVDGRRTYARPFASETHGGPSVKNALPRAKHVKTIARTRIVAHPLTRPRDDMYECGFDICWRMQSQVPSHHHAVSKSPNSHINKRCIGRYTVIEKGRWIVYRGQSAGEKT